MGTKLSFFKVGLLIVSIVLTSCSAEDGADGATGLQGLQGTAGADGADGEDGQDGNANVIYSDWFQPNAWTGGGTAFAFFDQAAIDLTQEVIDHGAVLAYAKLSGDGTNVRPLPADTGNGLFLWNYLIASVENIRFTVTRTDATSNVNPGTTNQFRYVIIPGGVLASKGFTSGDFKKMSYEEVMDHFGLEY